MINSCCGDPSIVIQQHYFFCEDEQIEILLLNIFHKNKEISILTIKKKTARLTLLQEATERTRQGETQNKTKHKKHTAV
jgi:hypothetical protein